MGARGVKPRPPEPPVELPPDMKHGSFRAYQTYKCKCLKCQTHRRQYARAYYWSEKAVARRDGHGTLHFYNKLRCRCERCKAARKDYDHQRWLLKNPEATRRTKLPRVYGGWYVCAEDGVRFKRHSYLAGQCHRCDAKQATEEFWETRWETRT